METKMKEFLQMRQLNMILIFQVKSTESLQWDDKKY